SSLRQRSFCRPDDGGARFHSRGRGEDVVDQVRGRLDFDYRLEPAHAGLSLDEEWAARRTGLAVDLKSLSRSSTESAVQGLREEGLKLCAMHSGLGFACHQTTCLFIRERRRASSARPRLILD